MKKKLIAAAVLCGIFANTATGQPYTKGRHTRHRFAQLNLGMDTRLLPSGNSYSYQPNIVGAAQRFSLGNSYEARAVIGGTHFWGHADFFVAIPVYTRGSNTKTGPETGARAYPWAITQNKLRPYGSVGAVPVTYRQGDGPLSIKMRTPVGAGITYNTKQHLADIGISWYYRNEISYYISPGTERRVRQQQIAVSLGYKWMLETTLSAEKNWQNGKTKALTDTLARRGRLNGLTIAAGPSTAFYTRKSQHNASIPHLGHHKIAAIFADVGIGYYWLRPDIQANIAWRRYRSEIAAYGTEQNALRRSVALECYKFLGDYHGFVPFAGPVLSHEKLVVCQVAATGEVTAEAQKVSPGITFGWDIRPDKLQCFYLRTNLRYFPRLHVTMPNGKDVALDGLEVNFIQLVVFPGRIRKAKYPDR